MLSSPGNGKLRSDRSGPMFHDLHAHAAGDGQIAWNANAVVADGQRRPFSGALQGDEHLSGLAMFHGIVHGFLCDAKQVGRSILIFDEHRIIAPERAMNVKKLGDGLGQPRECFHQSFALGFDRVKPVGEIARFMDARVEQVANLFCILCIRVLSGGQSAVKQAAHHRRPREVLAESVVQFLGDKLFFALADSKQLFLQLFALTTGASRDDAVGEIARQLFKQFDPGWDE